MLDLLTPNRHLNSRPFWTCCNGFVSEIAKTAKNYWMSILCRFSSEGCSGMGMKSVEYCLKGCQFIFQRSLGRLSGIVRFVIYCFVLFSL